MKADTLLFRQGDVLLERVTAIPADVLEIKREGCVVLAEGETSGHQHVIKSPGIRVYAPPQSEQPTYLEIAEALALLEHEEHSPIRLEKGIYRVTQQREFLPKETPRRVLD